MSTLILSGALLVAASYLENKAKTNGNIQLVASIKRFATLFIFFVLGLTVYASLGSVVSFAETFHFLP